MEFNFNDCIRDAHIIPNMRVHGNDLGDVVVLMRLDQNWIIADWDVDSMRTFIDNVNEKHLSYFMLNGEWDSDLFWTYDPATDSIIYEINHMGQTYGTYTSRVDYETIHLLNNLHDLVSIFKLTGCY